MWVYKYDNTNRSIQIKCMYNYVCFCQQPILKCFSRQVESEQVSSKEEDLAAALEEWREKCDRIHLESEKMWEYEYKHRYKDQYKYKYKYKEWREKCDLESERM